MIRTQPISLLKLFLLYESCNWYFFQIQSKISWTLYSSTSCKSSSKLYYESSNKVYCFCLFYRTASDWSSYKEIVPYLEFSLTSTKKTVKITCTVSLKDIKSLFSLRVDNKLEVWHTKNKQRMHIKLWIKVRLTCCKLISFTRFSLQKRLWIR